MSDNTDFAKTLELNGHSEHKDISPAASLSEKENVGEPMAQVPTAATTRTDIEDYAAAAASLTPEHRDYLLKRHGTLNLSPMPSSDPADPLNWADWKKQINLILVAFHAFMAVFTAASIIPAFELLAEALGTSLTKASYLTSAQIAILGVAPFFWKPLGNRFGRRPIWLISTACSLACNLGCAYCKTYGAMMVVRILTAFFICPAMALGSATVVETFFARQRATKMGVWTLLVTLGPPVGPFIMGFVAYHTGGFQWIYFIIAIINGVQFVLYFFFGAETLYIRSNEPPKGSAFKREYLNFTRIDKTPITFRDFYAPALLVKHVNILIPVVSYTMIFGFCSVLLTVEIPQIYGSQYYFNAQQLGLQFLAIIIGSVLGEQVGGFFSDKHMNMKMKRNGGIPPPPEYRLRLAYPGFVAIIVGLIVFGVMLQEEPEHWSVVPLVGIAIATFGNQVITSVLVTYAVDCHRSEAASIGVFTNLIRSEWGFIGPFYYPAMFENVGLAGSAGIEVAMIFVVSVIPVAILHWKASSIREKRLSHVRTAGAQARTI